MWDGIIHGNIIMSNIAESAWITYKVGYGGGIRNIEDMKKIFKIGGEKIIINSYAIENPLFVKEASNQFGSQSIVVSIDVKKNMSGEYEVFFYWSNGTDVAYNETTFHNPGHGRCAIQQHYFLQSLGTFCF